MQEIKAWDKFEVRPELSVLLEENFLQDDKGRWYIPDITKAADVAKLREKKLLKEFEGYSGYKRQAQTIPYRSNQSGLCQSSGPIRIIS
jgi:hypothetical protein